MKNLYFTKNYSNEMDKLGFPETNSPQKSGKIWFKNNLFQEIKGAALLNRAEDLMNRVTGLGPKLVSGNSPLRGGLLCWDW